MNNKYLHSKQLQRIRAFSLIEIMVVLVLIGLLASVVVIGARAFLVKGRQEIAKAQIKTLDNGITNFYTMNKRYPTNEEGLAILFSGRNPLIEGGKVPKDPWGNDYVYRNPGRDNQRYEIISYGEDGREGGTDENADLVSWDLAQE